MLLLLLKTCYKTVGNSHAPPRTQVHGVWNPWVEWSDCTVTCGGGNRTRERSCEEPQHGGDPCEGPTSQLEFCGDAPCPGICIEAYYYYRPQRSWAKVIFSQACVCPQGGVCLSACWDIPPFLGADMPPWEQTQPPGSRHPREQTPPRPDLSGADPPPQKQTPA